mmetsp:Transcript_17041/g.22193  ORF Transcript_17041/g.22193 Transcript_17041/m.22193 type:complete len:266 (+) Transcript_17041:3-800(+)
MDKATSEGCQNVCDPWLAIELTPIYKHVEEKKTTESQLKVEVLLKFGVENMTNESNHRGFFVERAQLKLHFPDVKCGQPSTSQGNGVNAELTTSSQQTAGCGFVVGPLPNGTLSLTHIKTEATKGVIRHWWCFPHNMSNTTASWYFERGSWNSPNSHQVVYDRNRIRKRLIPHAIFGPLQVPEVSRDASFPPHELHASWTTMLEGMFIGKNGRLQNLVVELEFIMWLREIKTIPFSTSLRRVHSIDHQHSVKGTVTLVKFSTSTI